MGADLAHGVQQRSAGGVDDGLPVGDDVDRRGPPPAGQRRGDGVRAEIELPVRDETALGAGPPPPPRVGPGPGGGGGRPPPPPPPRAGPPPPAAGARAPRAVSSRTGSSISARTPS
ncbi:hypothetical protein, partial [Nocardia wallacei]|uniref:hypothetical protein n=1 Tax=Nocardia wallacei TaxID=480035 RepID=UPI002455153D